MGELQLEISRPFRLTNFWETLDQLADTSLPEVDWRGGHQKEWPFIKPLLKAAGKTASSISCPSPSGPNCPRRVVELDDGRLVAECQDTPAVCKRLDLTAQCVAISKLDRGKFAAMVCKALDLAVSTKKAGTDGVFHVGDRQVAAGRGVPVFALFQGGSQPEKSVVALEALEKFASPRLLLVPTSQTLSSDQKTYLGRTGTTHMAFDDAIFCDDVHVAQASPAITQILDRLVTEVSQTLQATPAGLVWQMPADARWGDVKIAFISDEVINVTFRGETRRFEPSHLGGFATGDYMCKCMTCGGEFTGDKRAMTCLPCVADRIDAARSEAQPSGYDGLRQALAEAIEFAEQDWQALTPEGDAMLDRWRAALTFTASLSDASPSSGDE